MTKNRSSRWLRNVLPQSRASKLFTKLIRLQKIHKIVLNVSIKAVTFERAKPELLDSQSMTDEVLVLIVNSNEPFGGTTALRGEGGVASAAGL